MNPLDMNSARPFRRPLKSLWQRQSKETSQLEMKRVAASAMLSLPSSQGRDTNKDSNAQSILIQLCLRPDEDEACRTVTKLLSSRSRWSPNLSNEFHCNALMCSLRYQRFRLFDYFLNETLADLDLRAKDQQGNSILHYAVFYSKDHPSVIEHLLDKLNKYRIDVDQRNNFGFTPSLFGQTSPVRVLRTSTSSSSSSDVLRTIRSRLHVPDQS